MIEGYVSKNFSFKEMSCKCGCGTRNVDPLAIRKLQALRDILGVPLTINSAARCEKHNKDIGGAPNSRHISSRVKHSDAFDIAIVGLLTSNTLVKAALSVGFKGIGLAHNFVHVDCRQDEATWTY